MRGKNGLGFGSQEKIRILKSYMKGIMNDENTWDNKTSDTLSVEEPIMPISDVKVSSAIKISKNGKASDFSEVIVEMIKARCELMY